MKRFTPIPGYAATSFQGNFVNWRTIEGTYITLGSELSHTPSHGKWKVTLLKRS
jgi:hypothetical protein